MNQKPDKNLTATKFIDNGAGIISALAEFPKETLLDESAMGHAFNVCARTIRRMVVRYELPPPIPVAGKSMWIAGRVLAWLEANAERAEKDVMRKIERLSQYNT